MSALASNRGYEYPSKCTTLRIENEDRWRCWRGISSFLLLRGVTFAGQRFPGPTARAEQGDRTGGFDLPLKYARRTCSDLKTYPRGRSDVELRGYESIETIVSDPLQGLSEQRVNR